MVAVSDKTMTLNVNDVSGQNPFIARGVPPDSTIGEVIRALLSQMGLIDKVDGRPVLWEACQTLSGSWGYHRDETTWKSPGQLIRMLINTVARGGNLLMNVGPTPKGKLDQRAADALAVYAWWMEENGDSIYGCTQSEYTEPIDCRLTQKDNKVYVHVFAWPFKHLYVEGLGDKVAYARFLHDGSEIPLKLNDWTSRHLQAGENALVLELPVIQPDVVVPVIELELKS